MKNYKVSNKAVIEWIEAFNNAAFKGIVDMHFKFVASKFAVNGMKAELGKYGVNVVHFGGNEYGINAVEKRKYHFGA